MAQLPQPSRDNGYRGLILNNYLSQAHKTCASLKDTLTVGISIVDNVERQFLVESHDEII